jgi:hypothetical protein
MSVLVYCSSDEPVEVVLVGDERIVGGQLEDVSISLL